MFAFDRAVSRRVRWCALSAVTRQRGGCDGGAGGAERQTTGRGGVRAGGGTFSITPPLAQQHETTHHLLRARSMERGARGERAEGAGDGGGNGGGGGGGVLPAQAAFTHTGPSESAPHRPISPASVSPADRWHHRATRYPEGTLTAVVRLCDTPAIPRQAGAPSHCERTAAKKTDLFSFSPAVCPKARGLRAQCIAPGPSWRWVFCVTSCYCVWCSSWNRARVTWVGPYWMPHGPLCRWWSAYTHAPNRARRRSLGPSRHTHTPPVPARGRSHQCYHHTSHHQLHCCT
jgi:hypothetical protein